MISQRGAASRKTLRMSDNHKARVKEQAEAYLRQLRMIPHCEALKVMEQLIDELYKLREQTHYGVDYMGPIDSCEQKDKE